MEPRAPAHWSLTRAIFRLIVVAIVGTALVFVAAPFFAFRAVKAAARRIEEKLGWRMGSFAAGRKFG